MKVIEFYTSILVYEINNLHKSDQILDFFFIWVKVNIFHKRSQAVIWNNLY